MKTIVVEWVVSVLFAICFANADEEGPCTSVDDYPVYRLNESVCYLKCLSDALNKLYTDGERKLLVNEEVYANASRIIDNIEGKTGESVTYLSVISGVMKGKHDKLEKLISYGNTMGDLVAKVGGLFAEVNESVRAVREDVPTALMTANKYYAAIAEIARTVWDDVKGLGGHGKHECEDIVGVKEFQLLCPDHTCPLKEGVNESALQKYKDGCLDINVLNGSVSECFNVPRSSLYKNGGVNKSKEGTNWYSPKADFFQLKVEVQKIFGPLIAPFSSGLQPFVLAEMMSNITSLYSHFKEVHSNFTSMLHDTNISENVNSTHSTI
uniref:Expression site-associated gene 1 (ESAG 1), putative n=1 Tax=Trypanosoma brucei brucei (strain 927/4 GUTat10.1) TaxID=185431 RepID=Q4FKT7_TRYB2|nr:expression site-associated gene 1 (ESAG 1), putative [Trypanosoma brucei brucei TREU927]